MLRKIKGQFLIGPQQQWCSKSGTFLLQQRCFTLFLHTNKFQSFGCSSAA